MSCVIEQKLWSAREIVRIDSAIVCGGVYIKKLLQGLKKF